jgi:hypothetical protein
MSQNNERSLHQIKRETEQARAGLTDTVEQLRSQVSETASDIRHRISPDAIKAEVGDYIRSRGEHLRDSVTQAARDNPMQAMAVGVSVAYPLFRMARSIPLPVLMIGAGLYFAGSKTGQATGRKASRMASDFADDIGRRTHDARDALSAAQQQVADRFGDASTAVSSGIASGVDSLRQGRDAAGNLISAGVEGLRHQRDAAGNAISEGVNTLMGKRDAVGNALSASADNLKHQAGAARNSLASGAASASAVLSDDFSAGASTVSAGLSGLKTQAADALNSATGLAQDYAGRAASTFRGAAGGAADTARRARAPAAALTHRAGATLVDTVQQNPLAVAGIGLAIGALIASCLPASDVEKGVMGKASNAVRNRVRDAASQGMDAAKDIASGVYDDVTQRIADEGLDTDGFKQAAQGLGDRVRKVAENTVATAFELPSTPKTH